MRVNLNYLPKEIKVGNTIYIQERDNPGQYNVNGRNYFERVHITQFPKEVLQRYHVGVKIKDNLLIAYETKKTRRSRKLLRYRGTFTTEGESRRTRQPGESYGFR